MSDKSPRQAMSKKPAKTLKQKRADKRAKVQDDHSIVDAQRDKRR